MAWIYIRYTHVHQVGTEKIEQKTDKEKKIEQREGSLFSLSRGGNHDRIIDLFCLPCHVYRHEIKVTIMVRNNDGLSCLNNASVLVCT